MNNYENPCTFDQQEKIKQTNKQTNKKKQCLVDP